MADDAEVPGNSGISRRAGFLSAAAEATYIEMLSSLDTEGIVLDDDQRQELAARDLIYERPGRRAGRYLAVTPVVAYISVQDRARRALTQLRADVARAYELVDRLQSVYASSRIIGEAVGDCEIVRSGQVSPVISAFHAVVRSQLRVWNTGPFLAVQRVESMLDTIVLPDRDAMQRGARVLGTYDQGALELPGGKELVAKCAEVGEEVRIVPRLPMKLYVLDERAALVPLEPFGATALLIRDPSVARIFARYFDLIWARATPYGEVATATPTATATGPAPGTRQPSAVSAASTVPPRRGSARLISLMADGLKDEAIARHLGVSVRTVRRQITELCRQLRAPNRFAAGIAAWRAGLVDIPPDQAS